MRVALIQLAAGADKAANVQRTLRLTEKAFKSKARWVLLPEMFNWRGDTANSQALRCAAERIPGESIQPFLAAARRHKAFILAGSVLEQTAGPKFYNTSVLINPQGRIAAKYRKIHLFDACLGDKILRESKYLKAGDTKAEALVDKLCVGLSICYDLRFADIYRWYGQQGAQVMTVPSCFTKTTGQAHWEVLLRARAIENLCYVLAPNQVGTSVRGVQAYGNSMIVSPWGEVLARGSGDREEIVYGDIDRSAVIEARKKLPGVVREDL